MAFIGFAILISLGMALVISSDAGQLVGLTQDQMGQIIPLILVLILVASGMFGRRIRFSQMLSGIVLWAGFFAIVVTGYSYRHELSDISQKVLSELAPGIAVVDENSQTAMFSKGFGNTFYISSQINGAKISMIFDTGASAVVLTHSDAIAAGINMNKLRYTISVQTANGTGKAAGVTLDEINVGGIIRNDIRAFIARPGALETSLLGMSFLQTLEAYSVSKDRLELQG